jgi:hypothetical protein
MRGLLFIVFNVHVTDSVWQTYCYEDPVNRAKKNSAARAYSETPSAVAVASAYISSAHGHVDVTLPNSIANRHANEFSVAVAGSAEMEAEKIMVRACVWISVGDVYNPCDPCAGLCRCAQSCSHELPNEQHAGPSAHTCEYFLDVSKLFLNFSGSTPHNLASACRASR